jgi:hypothetical protein
MATSGTNPGALPPGPLLSLRSAVIFTIAFGVAVAIGVLTCLGGGTIPASVIAGILVFGGCAAGLHKLIGT